MIMSLAPPSIDAEDAILQSIVEDGIVGPDARQEDPAQAMLRAELTGKHNAAQVYDERMWKIRTGFLTLVFGGWAALLGIGSGSGSGLDAVRQGCWPMFVVTLALGVTACIIECFYVARKYRCVGAINELSYLLYKGQFQDEHERRWFRFTGDDPAGSFGEGFKMAFFETLLVYSIPVLGIGGAVLVLLKCA
jgi:hypothetical protein